MPSSPQLPKMLWPRPCTDRPLGAWPVGLVGVTGFNPAAEVRPTGQVSALAAAGPERPTVADVIRPGQTWPTRPNHGLCGLLATAGRCAGRAAMGALDSKSPLRAGSGGCPIARYSRHRSPIPNLSRILHRPRQDRRCRLQYRRAHRHGRPGAGRQDGRGRPRSRPRMPRPWL